MINTVPLTDISKNETIESSTSPSVSESKKTIDFE
jgi:hypothetical protein